MPTYDVQCKKCSNEYEIFLTFSEYDEKIKQQICPSCGSKKVIRTYNSCPDVSIKQYNTIGSAIEKNTKKLGKKVQEEKLKKKESTPKPKQPWYGTLPKDKQKKIFGAPTKEAQQKAANDYILKGE